MTDPSTVDTRWDIDAHVRNRVANLLELAQGRMGGGVLGKLDPIHFLPALSKTAAALAANPNHLMDVGVRSTADALQTLMTAVMRAAGMDVGGPEPKDKRFADPAWTKNPAFWWLRHSYIGWERAVLDLLGGAAVAPDVQRKATFAAQLVLDALAPTNFPWLNPAVIRRAVETNGQSAARGMRNYFDDLATNSGQPRQVATGVHEVGKNLAVTPGKVVYRNRLMELIQYTPTTETVHEIPLLLSPPWINKYYVMDLSPGRSLVEWAVKKGHTVFLLSYRNPDESMRDVTLDDYLLHGPLEALDVIEDITGSPKVNLLALCLGGTLTMGLLSYLNATGRGDRINSATFLNTLVDFSDPGVLGVFTDEKTVTKLEKDMKESGFLASDNMRHTFDLLRSNDLIWNYVVNNWMLGEDPPAFDILTWNADATRMPADMHSFYLRSCYVENQLAQGNMELAGERLDVSTVDQDLYFLAAEQDHIAPWRSSYKGALLPKGDVRFVLSNAGHIAGIVNPPHPKSQYRVVEGGELPSDPDAWLARATVHQQTWWEDWANWVGQRAGEQRTPPPLGSQAHQVLADAPGTYIYQS